jgi:prevent-host-death family protein
MEVPVSEAKATLTELVSRAERGEDVILTRHGHPVVRLLLVPARRDPAARRALINDIRALARTKAQPGPDAARSQDDLYDEDGLPA